MKITARLLFSLVIFVTFVIFMVIMLVIVTMVIMVIMVVMVIMVIMMYVGDSIIWTLSLTLVVTLSLELGDYVLIHIL